MSLWRQLSYGLRRLTNRAQHERELAEEVEQYFAEAIAEGQSRGLSAQEARREAGNPGTAKERVTAYGWENSARNFFANLRFAGRQLRKHPLFTVAATLTLALGIGSNAAIFTVVQSVLLAPLPYTDSGKLAVLQTHWTDSGHTTKGVTGPDAVDVRDQASSLAAVSLYHGGTLGVQLRDHSIYTIVALVDANFASVFSLRPIAGALFTDNDAHHAALVGERFAREHFGSPQAAVGQLLHVESEPLQIAGVLPAAFDYPAGTQVWEAAPLRPESMERTAFNYRAVARLSTATDFQRSQTELDGISRRLERAYPDANRNKRLWVVPLQHALTGNARPTLLFLWATVGLILLIACVNVTHLQLVRSMDRQRELAIRRAIGSSRWQVVQPVILESLLVSLIGGAAGVLSAYPAVRVLVAMAPKELPRASEIHLNGWVLVFALTLAVCTALASSVLPALRAARVDPAEALKCDHSRGMGIPTAVFLRDGMVMAQVAATFVLAMGAGLLLHTMMALRTRDLGYRTRQLLVVDADAPAHSEADGHRAVQTFEQIFAQLGALPGVEHVAGVMGLPTGDYGSNGYYQTRGGLPIDPLHKPWSIFSVASPGYFETMAIPLKRGRDFSAQDSYESAFVAVISEALAKQSFGNANPVGKQIQCGLDSDRWMTIIGVVGDVRQESPAENTGPALYMPMAQHPFYSNQIHIVVRTGVEPLATMHAVEETIRRANPLIAMRFTTMDAMVNQSVAAERFRAVLLSAFAGVGILLAMLGVYGTMAYSVTQRTFEIGVRIAFGAGKGTILQTVLAQAARLTCFGIALGLLVSLLLVRLVNSLLVGVKPYDPASLALASLLLMAAALIAAFAPAWKATHLDPTIALRSE